jgi:PAS domain S-box-containing protein
MHNGSSRPRLVKLRAQHAPEIWILLGGGVVALTLFLATPVVSPSSGILLDNLQQLTAMIAALAATSISLRASTPHRRRIRQAILLALFTALGGSLLWFLQPDGSTSRSLLADSIFVVGVLFGLGSLTWALFEELDSSVRISVAIDGAILFTAAWTLVFAIDPLAAAGAAFSADLVAMLAVASLFAFVAAWMMALTARGVQLRFEGPWAIMAGLLTVGVAWMSWLAVSAHGSTDQIAVTDYLLSVGILAFAYGGCTWDATRTVSAHALSAVRGLSDSLPIVAIVVTVALNIVPHPDEALNPADIGAAVVMLLAVWRQTRLLRHEQALERAHGPLAEIVTQSPESILVTDLSGSIQYVNPAFERITGYTAAEVVGRNPRLLKSGQQSDAFYTAMWAALTAGTPWVADLTNRRKDGTLYEEEAVVSPVRDAAGQITGYVAVQRDVSRERAAEALAERLHRERSMIAAAISNLVPASSPEETMHAVCTQLITMTELQMAGIYAFTLDTRTVPLAIITADGIPTPLGELRRQRSEYLQERAAGGPWVEHWSDQPWLPFLREPLVRDGGEVAYVPMRHAGAVMGVLLAAKSLTASVPLAEDLPALVEFAEMAAIMLGPALASRSEVTEARGRIAVLIADHAFHPVFQPIVDTRRNRVVAYEALTRFDDGAAPNLHFDRAAAIGMGIELERATLEAAITASCALSPRIGLHLNASPALILAGDALPTLLAKARRRVVLEVTEHTPIEDYAALRAALTALGPRVRLAVDDAGAGFASLRHILELQPAIVKLDRSVIGGVDDDLAREAMVAGMAHFAHETDCQLLAEGVETVGELLVLQEHGIWIAQGFLLGRPAQLVEQARGVMDHVA